MLHDNIPPPNHHHHIKGNNYGEKTNLYVNPLFSTNGDDVIIINTVNNAHNELLVNISPPSPLLKQPAESHNELAADSPPSHNHFYKKCSMINGSTNLYKEPKINVGSDKNYTNQELCAGGGVNIDRSNYQTTANIEGSNVDTDIVQLPHFSYQIASADKASNRTGVGAPNGNGRSRSPLFSRHTNYSPKPGRKLANYHLIPNPITGKM